MTHLQPDPAPADTAARPAAGLRPGDPPPTPNFAKAAVRSGPAPLPPHPAGPRYRTVGRCRRAFPAAGASLRPLGSRPGCGGRGARRCSLRTAPGAPAPLGPARRALPAHRKARGSGRQPGAPLTSWAAAPERSRPLLPPPPPPWCRSTPSAAVPRLSSRSCRTAAASRPRSTPLRAARQAAGSSSTAPCPAPCRSGPACAAAPARQCTALITRWRRGPAPEAGGVGLGAGQDLWLIPIVRKRSLSGSLCGL